MDLEARARAALTHGAPRDELWELARTAARAGATQEALVEVFSALRRDLPDALDDQVLDVLDAITGFCHPDRRIFRT